MSVPPETPDFGLLLRMLREEASLTQEELAERSGVSIRAISDLERGRTRKPHRRSVRLLAEAFRLDGGENEEFRRIARREPTGDRRRTTTGLGTFPRPEPAIGDPPRSRPDLVEWMRQILVDEQAGEHDPAGADQGSCRAVQLVGDLGVGKAALVTQVFTRLWRYFPGGRFYLNAETAGRGPAALVDWVTRLLGAEPDSDRTVDDRVGRLRTLVRSQRVLLVLDNVTDAHEVLPLLRLNGLWAVIVIAPHGLAPLAGVWTIDVRSPGPSGARDVAFLSVTGSPRTEVRA